MWLLHLLPTAYIQWIVHSVLVFGIVGTIVSNFLSYIPGIIQYRIPIKIISFILLTTGLFFEGGYSTELVWRQRVADVEAKVAIAEAKSAEANAQIKEVVVENIKVVKEKVYVNHTIIKTNKEVINAECKIPDVALKIYNTAVTNGDAK